MLGSFLYLEFLVPVRDYFSTINKKELLFEWGLPFLFSFIAYFYLSIGGIQYQNNVNKLNSEILGTLSVLLGFSMASVTLLVTSSSTSINALKGKDSDRRIVQKTVKMYQLILITFTFLMLVELLGMFLNISYSFFLDTLGDSFWKEFTCLNLLIMAHVIFLNVRNLVNIYMTSAKTGLRLNVTKVKKTAPLGV